MGQAAYLRSGIVWLGLPVGPLWPHDRGGEGGGDGAAIPAGLVDNFGEEPAEAATLGG